MHETLIAVPPQATTKDAKGRCLLQDEGACLHLLQEKT
jgi:hypothetical protein